MLYSIILYNNNDDDDDDDDMMMMTTTMSTTTATTMTMMMMLGAYLYDSVAMASVRPCGPVGRELECSGELDAVSNSAS